MAALRAVSALFVVVLVFPPTVARAQDLSCNQEPGSRFFWAERAFCDLRLQGPEQAHGVIIWNHGISGTTESWRAPVPPALRLLQQRGWDVIAIKRHNLAETMAGGPLHRTVERTLQEVTAQRKLGYRRVVLAGQSFGGYASLEALDTASEGLHAVLAFAPGVRESGAFGNLDVSVIERILQRARTARLVLVFPARDSTFRNALRGPRAKGILASRDVPYVMVDESVSELQGHGAATTGRFAVRYGACLAAFLAAPEMPAGPFTCPVANEGSVARELLAPPKGLRLTPVAEVPETVANLVGLYWGLIEDTVVLVGLVESERPGPGLRLLYRSTSTRPGGGVYDATVKDKQVHAVLGNKSTAVLSGETGVTLTWTSPDGARVLKAPLSRVPDD
ncbi:MAG TPA: alpha/beta hydrolase [Methylomirabilota bacterium]|jgi:pimeloyl-ACP methyl ester carboxylesterase